MTPRQNDLLLIALLCVQSLIAAVVLADADALGLNRTLVSWLVVLQVPLTLLGNQLKALGARAGGQSPLQQPPNDPVADRPEIPVPPAVRARMGPR